MIAAISSKEKEVLAAISRLGVATEIELQSITFMELDYLKKLISELESKDLIKREYGFLSKVEQGDGLKITDKGIQLL